MICVIFNRNAAITDTQSLQIGSLLPHKTFYPSHPYFIRSGLNAIRPSLQTQPAAIFSNNPVSLMCNNNETVVKNETKELFGDCFI